MNGMMAKYGSIPFVVKSPGSPRPRTQDAAVSSGRSTGSIAAVSRRRRAEGRAQEGQPERDDCEICWW